MKNKNEKNIKVESSNKAKRITPSKKTSNSIKNKKQSKVTNATNPNEIVIYDKLTNRHITLYLKPETSKDAPKSISKIERVKDSIQTCKIKNEVNKNQLTPHPFSLYSAEMFDFNSYPLSFRMKYIFKLKFSMIKLKINALFKRKSGKVYPSKNKYFSKNQTTVNYLAPLNAFSKDYYLKRVKKLFMKDVLNGSNFDFVNTEKIKNKWNKKC